MKRFKLEDYQNRLDETNRANIIVKNIFLKQSGKKKRRYLNCFCTKCGYEWNTFSGNLMNKNINCPKCSKHVHLTIDEINERIEISHPHIKLLSKNINKGKDILKFYCKKHDIIFRCSYNSLFSKYGCVECTKYNIKGVNHHSWKGGVTPLYNYVRENSLRQ